MSKALDVFDDVVEILDAGHVYLKKYRVISMLIIGFFAYQCYDLTAWYKIHYSTMQDWQNAPVIGLITAYVAALKFGLNHILSDSDRDGADT